MATQNDFDFIIPHQFEARPYQVPFLRAVEKAINGESKQRFFIQVWHRRSGKDKSNIADIVPRRLVKDPCLVKYVFPTLVMGRDNLWDAIGKDGVRYLDHIPYGLRAGEMNQQRMQIPVNNGTGTPSIFQVDDSNKPDTLRGGNPKLYILSEYAEQNPYALDVIMPIVRENDGIVIFNFTPKGKNHAKYLVDAARNDPEHYFVQVLSVNDTHVFTPDQIVEIRKDLLNRFSADGRSEDEAISYFNQEYLCSFEGSVMGAYYGASMTKAEQDHRITSVPYERTIPVQTAWDLGMDDSMTIWFYQTVGMSIRFIDYYENSGEGLSHYAKVLQDKGYIYGRHHMPHDVAVRELGTGKSRFETAQTMGIRPLDIAPALGIDEGINAARSIFNQCWFDQEKCMRGLNCLRNYTKDWNDKLKVFRNEPLHNWASHGSDAFRTFATSYKRQSGFTQPMMTDPSRPWGGVRQYIPGVG